MCSSECILNVIHSDKDKTLLEHCDTDIKKKHLKKLGV